MSGIPINLIFVLLLIAGVIWLQIFLSRKESKVLGLILPGLNFLYSLIVMFNLLADDLSGFGLFGLIFSTFLLANIPTMIFIIIYFVCKKSIKKNKEIEKMNIHDLN